MKHTTLLFGGAVVCTAGWLAACGLQQSSMAQEKQPDRVEADRDTWMQVKLTSAQQILEHLTSGDFQKLETSSRRMQVLNFMEQWSRDAEFTQKSEYQGQLNVFEFATKELIRHAQDRDIDGSLKAYTKLTESCVNCHKLIRDDK